MKNRELSILLAEDSLVYQKIITHMLHQVGHVVQVVANGADAIEAVRAGCFDVVLMDVHMPSLDGLAAARAIRALPDGKRLPILAVTADALLRCQQSCLAAGMNGHLHKPLKPEQLAAALEQATSNS